MPFHHVASGLANHWQRSQVWHPGAEHTTRSCNDVQDVLGIKELQHFCHFNGGNDSAARLIAFSIWSTVLIKISKIIHKTPARHRKRYNLFFFPHRNRLIKV